MTEREALIEMIEEIKRLDRACMSHCSHCFGPVHELAWNAARRYVPCGERHPWRRGVTCHLPLWMGFHAVHHAWNDKTVNLIKWEPRPTRSKRGRRGG